MENARTILELLYFASAPLLAIIAAVGLWQLKITRDNAKIAAQRESLRISAEQCNFYLSHIVPMWNKFDKLIADRKFTSIGNVELNINEKNQIRITPKDPKKFLDEIFAISHEIVDLANLLEAFSIYFASGVASERTAFDTIGVTFCKSMERLIPAMLVFGEGKYHKNTLKLFFLWHQRTEAIKLAGDKRAIEKRLEAISGKHIEPLGT